MISAACRFLSAGLSKAGYLLGHRILVRPKVSLVVILLLLATTASVILYVQRTLLEIEESLPITLSEQERDIRKLVNEMGKLVNELEIARSNKLADRRLASNAAALRQADLVNRQLEEMRGSYRFNDLIGVSRIHAIISPAVYDIKTWLTQGISNFEPTSAQTLKIAEDRARAEYDRAKLGLVGVVMTASDQLTEQADRMKSFRTVMSVTLVVLALMTIGLVILGLRLQRIVFALKESEEQIRYRANYDSLTRLPNRANFVDQLADAITRERRTHTLTALLFIDLDRFKTINDTLGHDFGDELIKQVAVRIRQATRETDVVARLGGDEFTVMLADVSDEIHASLIAKNIIARLAQPYLIDGHEVYTSASIGITISPLDGEDVNTLLKNADMAMYEAKDRGRNTFQFFTSQMTDRARQFMEIDKDMRMALARDDLDVHFQPIYSTAKRTVVGFEALLRWQHPEKGLILPNDFIAVAEETGLIEDVGLWVLRRACSEARKWLKHDIDRDFYLAVNISMRQFKGGFDRDQLKRVLHETGFPADRLLLEITESLLMDDDTRIFRVLEGIRDLGVRLAVDDFGTGYSALSYLREFPVDTLKIDSSFIHSANDSTSNRRLVEAIVAMAHGLNLVTIAEGVETEEQNALMVELGCDMVQGHFYCEAVTAGEIETLVSSGRPQVRVVRSR